jgi:hypothetical protein
MKFITSVKNLSIKHLSLSMTLCQNKLECLSMATFFPGNPKFLKRKEPTQV